MGKRRVNRYPKAFRPMALDQMRSSGNASALALELGIDRTVLYRWRNLMPAGDLAEEAASPVRERRKEIRDLKRVRARQGGPGC